jgi:hypothetical protein
MSIVGWLQIAVFAATIGLLTRPLGGYLARVYGGERTLLRPLLGPLEQALYRQCVEDKEGRCVLQPVLLDLRFDASASPRPMHSCGCNLSYRSIRKTCRASHPIWRSIPR